ncbi:MAG: membrane dipeptidase [Candidatus Tumulicola sp.]
MAVSAAASRVDDLLRTAIVWDNHTCMPLDPRDAGFLPQFERLRNAGVTVVGVNVGFGDQGIEPHVRMLAHFRAWIKARPETYLLVERADDVAVAKHTGRLGIFFDIEGANAIDDQLTMIPLYYDLGVRWMLMAYNRNNRVGGGCLDDDPGLSEFGRAVITEMNRVGMIPCCSHTGKRTVLDVITHSCTPIIFSHSNPRAVWDHARNIDDDVILACARRGGVVGINGVGAFLTDGKPNGAALARHLDYVAQLAGIDHVAIGLDYVFDQEELKAAFAATPHLFGPDAHKYPNGCPFAEPEHLAGMVAELVRMGYTDDDLRKILGLNWLRVARAVWK